MTNLFPNECVISTKLFDIHQDWEVPIPGFFILATKRVINSVGEFTPDEEREFITLLCKLRRGMHSELGIKDVYLHQNEDSVHHFHLWIFPRLPWMEKFGRKIESVRPIINHAKEHMNKPDVVVKVKDYVKKMRKYMKRLSKDV